MEMVLNNGFCEMTNDEFLSIAGGGGLEAAAAFVGTVLIGISPAAGVATGIGASIVATPVVGIAAGVAAGALLAASGTSLLDFACR